MTYEQKQELLKLIKLYLESNSDNERLTPELVEEINAFQDIIIDDQVDARLYAGQLSY